MLYSIYYFILYILYSIHTVRTVYYIILYILHTQYVLESKNHKLRKIQWSSANIKIATSACKFTNVLF